MSIKRYVASADTTITNAFLTNLTTRATSSNMGASDSMEVFSLYNQVNGSLEKTRSLIKFPIDVIIKDRNSGIIPASGSVKFFIKLYNAEHFYTLPKDFYLSVLPLSQSWDEGHGLDMEEYSDQGFGNNGYGANWDLCLSGTSWTSQGSSFLTQSKYDFKQHFMDGYEDLELDITNLVEEWASGDLQNNGVVIKLSGSYEDGSQKTSFYTKKFFARGTQYFYKKPILEVRWSDILKDDRSDFYSYSNLLSDTDNTYNLCFYNKFNGKLKNINSNPNLSIKLYSDSNYTNEVQLLSSSVTNPLPGIYKASIIVDTTCSILYDKWVNSSNTSSIFYKNWVEVKKFTPEENYSSEEYIYSLTNLKSKYSKDENVTFRIFSRLKNWNPNIYTVSRNSVENTCIKNLYYKIFRVEDGIDIVSYSTGSIEYSKISYDSAGNYFNFDMSMLEPDNSYGIQLARWDGNSLEEYKQVYKFRVE